MKKSPALYNTRAWCRFSAAVMVLAVLLPLMSPTAAVTATEGSALLKSANVLPAWWVDAEPSKETVLGFRAALPNWWQPVGSADVQASVDHLNLAAPPSATTGESFPTTIEARAGDDSLVSTTTTVQLAPDGAEPISPTEVELSSGTATVDATLEQAGPAKLVRVISGTIAGEDSITIASGSAARLSLSPSDSTITAGSAQAYTAVAYDEFDNEIGEVTSSTNFAIDAAAQGVWKTNVYDSQKAGAWTVLGTYRNTLGQDVTGSALLTVEPGELHHVRINSGPGDAPAVGTHTMDIYGEFPAWAGCYDAFDNYCGDVDAQWGGTGVIQLGQFTPSIGAATVFVPAPILSGLGALTATSVAVGAGDSTDQFILQAPQLIIGKSADRDPVPAGESLGYSIVYTNVGDAEAPSVVVTETYDANVSYDLSDIPPTQGDNVWDFGGLAPGESGRLFVVVRVDDSLEPDTVLNNVVTVGGPGLGQYAFTETTAVASTPELTLTLSGSPNPVDAGAYLNYRLHYENQGTAPVNGVRITMTYDAHVTPLAGSDNVWDVGRVDAGSGGDISVWVDVDDYMEDLYTLTTSGTITSDELGAYTAYQYNVVHAPALELAKRAATNPVLAGERLTYTLVYTNVGSVETSRLQLTDDVPDNTTYVSCALMDCYHSGGTVRWEARKLASGASRSATMVVGVDRNVDTGTALTNRARVLVYDTPSYSATAQITTAVVSSPSLRLSIANGTTEVEAGDELSYLVAYDNDGNGKAYDVRIVVTPPSSDVAMDPYCEPASDCVYSGGKLIYDVGTVPGGESDSVTMLVNMWDPLPAGADAITASAVISTVTPGDAPDDNHAQDVDAIATRPDLVVRALYEDSAPYPGKRVTYTLQYDNKGHIATTGVVVTATQPPFSTFKKRASDACWNPRAAGRYRCLFGELDHNESGELAFVVTLTTTEVTTPHFTSAITNFDTSFSIGDDGGSGEDANPDNNHDEAPLGVPNLVIEKVVLDRAIWEGSTGWLTVTIRNEGPGKVINNFDSHGKFLVDLFLNDEKRPVSFPIERAGHCYNFVDPIEAGQVQTTVISFTNVITHRYSGGFCGQPMPENDRPVPLKWIWFKVDNWDPIWEPNEPYGRVAEYDEDDNVWLEGLRLFLPIVYKNCSHYVVSAEPRQGCDPAGVGYGMTWETEKQSLDNGAHNEYDR